jgi:hypothetical protein
VGIPHLHEYVGRNQDGWTEPSSAQLPRHDFTPELPLPLHVRWLQASEGSVQRFVAI